MFIHANHDSVAVYVKLDNKVFVGGHFDLICIGPDPRDFLRRGTPGVSRLIEFRAQDVHIEMFSALEPGDIFPGAQDGVLMHIHDIFLPNDYPKPWAPNWNEQYFVQTRLMYSCGVEVLFGCARALARLHDLVKLAFGDNCKAAALGCANHPPWTTEIRKP